MLRLLPLEVYERFHSTITRRFQNSFVQRTQIVE